MSILSNVLQPVSGNVLQGILGGGGVPPVPVELTPPDAAFSVLPITVYRVGEGSTSTFTTNYDHESSRSSLSPAVIYWVDKDTGDNNNDGSMISPFRSIGLAAQFVKDSGGLGCIKVKGSTSGQPTRYQSDNTQARSGQSTNNATWKDCWDSRITDIEVIVEPWNEGELFDNVHIRTSNPTWSSTSDSNIWRNNSAFAQIIDYTNLDNNRAVRSLAEINLAAGTSEADAIDAVNAAYTTYSNITDVSGTNYALGVALRVESGFTLIRLFDNRNPNLGSDLITTGGGTGVEIDSTTKPCRFFSTGMGFVGQGFVAIARNGHRAPINMKNCRFIRGRDAGSFAIIEATDSDGADIILEDCLTHAGSNDGYNYHGYNVFAEIDCISTFSGWSGITTNNSSTCHESSIGVRVGGYGLNSEDRSIHDVNNADTWNLGYTSSTRRGMDGSDQSCAYASGQDADGKAAKMWLDACHVAAGVNGLPEYTTQVNDSGAFLYYANLDFTPVIGPSATPGTLTTYTP